MNFRDYFNDVYLEAFDNALNFLTDPQNSNLYLPQLEDKFHKDGGLVLGEGIAGKVYSHPKWNYVLKTFYADDCYLKFIRFATRNPRPAYPKIIGNVQRIVPHYARHFSEEKLYMVRMEKLELMDSEQTNTFISFQRIKNMIARTAVPGEVDIQLIHEAVNLVYRNGEIASHEMGNITELLSGFFAFYTDEKIMKGCMLDLHRYNVMVRPSTGQLVITDPLYYAYGGENLKILPGKFQHARDEFNTHLKRGVYVPSEDITIKGGKMRNKTQRKMTSTTQR